MPSFPSPFPDARTSRQTDHVSSPYPECQVSSDTVEPRCFNGLHLEARSSFPTAHIHLLELWFWKLLAFIKIQQRFYRICSEGPR